MKKIFVVLGLAVAMSGCSRNDALEITKGSDVTVQKRDGAQVTGRLVEVQPKHVIVQRRDGAKVQVLRTDIESVKAMPSAATPSAAAPSAAAPVATEGKGAALQPTDTKESSNPLTKMFERAPAYRDVTVPAGTVLPVELTTAVGSDSSQVEDPVRGTIRSAVTIDGVEVIPAGTAVLGHVTAAQRPGKVQGRGSIGLRFSQIDLPGDPSTGSGQAARVAISTGTISRLAPATKKMDAAKIGGGAAGGAIIGGIIGGGGGAAKGAAIGGGAGTAVVLSTRGKDVRLASGSQLSVKLTAPLTIRVPMK